MACCLRERLVQSISLVSTHRRAYILTLSVAFSRYGTHRVEHLVVQRWHSSGPQTDPAARLDGYINLLFVLTHGGRAHGIAIVVENSGASLTHLFLVHRGDAVSNFSARLRLWPLLHPSSLLVSSYLGFQLLHILSDAHQRLRRRQNAPLILRLIPLVEYLAPEESLIHLCLLIVAGSVAIGPVLLVVRAD